MDKCEALINEYNNLWQEKLTHKQSIRKLKGYISYLTSFLTISLTFFGISTTAIFSSLLNGQDISVFTKNISLITTIITLPFAPILLLVGSFAVNDMYHIYLMGNQISNIEKKLNKLLNEQGLFGWESKICPIAYGEKKRSNQNFENIIILNDKYIFFPIVICIFLISILFSIKLLYSINIIVSIVYVVAMTFLTYSFISHGIKLYKYTKPNGDLSKTIVDLNKIA